MEEPLRESDIGTEFELDPVPEPTFVVADLEAARARALEQRAELKEAERKSLANQGFGLWSLHRCTYRN